MFRFFVLHVSISSFSRFVFRGVHVPNRPSRTVHGASRGAQRPNRESGRRRPGQMLTTSISKRISASENSSFPSNFTNRFNKEFRVPPRFRTESFSHRVFEPADFASWFFRHDRPGHRLRSSERKTWLWSFAEEHEERNQRLYNG